MMNRFAKSLAVVTSTLFLLGFNAQAEKNEPGQNKIQRYTFTYNFNKTVSPVVKRTTEQQQYINYELMLEILTSANNTINTITNNITTTEELAKVYNPLNNDT